MKLGSHILIEFFDCNTSTINSLEKVEKLMVESVHISGATLVQPLFHQFSPHGRRNSKKQKVICWQNWVAEG